MCTCSKTHLEQNRRKTSHLAAIRGTAQRKNDVEQSHCYTIERTTRIAQRHMFPGNITRLSRVYSSLAGLWHSTVANRQSDSR